MSNKRLKSMVMLGLVLLLCIFAVLLLLSDKKRAEALTAEELLDGTGVTVEQNAALPDYMEKIWWNGQTYDADELTAVRLETDGSSSSATVTYNRVIDLSVNDGEIPFFDFIIAPAKGREFDGQAVSSPITSAYYEVRNLHIRLTDIYDSSNYVSLDFERRSDFWYYSSIRVSAPDMTSAGWVESSQALREAPYGTPLTSSFTGCPGDADGNYMVISTFFDYSERAVYAQPYGNKEKSIVRDLDSTDYLVPGESTLWNGFTTGEVTLSFSFDMITDSANAVVYLFTLNGQDFTGEHIDDTTPPVINAADENLYNGVPEAEVLRPYRIFDVTAYDALDGRLDVADIEVQVLEPDKTSLVQIGSDGCFIPSAAGVYTIVYSISDASGNTGKYEIEVTARGKLAGLQLVVENNDLRSEYSVGETVNIPYSIIVRGGAGAYRTSVTVLEYASGDAIETTSGRAIFMTPGYYAVVYRAEDYIGNVCVQKYFIFAKERTLPYVEEPSMPTAILAGKPFTFPSFTATDYSSYAGTPVTARKYFEVTSDNWNTSQIYKEGETFTPATEGTVKYKVCAENIIDSTEKYTGEEGTFAVVTPKNIGEYFYDPKGEVSADYTASEMYPRYKTEQDVSLAFINRLGVENFRFNFLVPAALSNFSQIEVNLKDSADAVQTVTVSISREGSHCSASMNKGSPVSINTAFTDSTFEMYISNGYIYVNATIIGQLDEDEAFTSGLLYLSVGISGVTGNAGFELRRINNQTYVGLFGEGENYDTTAPVIVPREEIEFIRYVGETIMVPAADVFDVLDPVASISMRVMRNEEIIYEQQDGADGVAIFADVPGEYLIIYTARDSSGNSVPAGYTIRVFNHSDPVLQVDGKLPAQVNVGDSVSVPKAEAKDFEGTSLTIHVFVIDADNYMRTAEDMFIAEKEGIYTVRYYCFDAYGCYVIRDYQIAVIGGGK